MKSVMVHNFSQVPKADIPRSSFNRSFGFKTTFDGGQLIPVFWDLALPGDTMNVRMNTFARMATPIAPFMDNLFCDSFFFAVPIRLIWNNWHKFNGAQDDPGDSTDFLLPVMTAPAVTGHLVGSLSDYLGIPTGVALLEHSSLWHRAYNLIWNEWFRDQNLQDSVVVDKDDGPDSSTDYTVLRRNKKHDYFTSCLPWPQKGPAVVLPLGESAPIRGWNNDAGAANDRIYFRTETANENRIPQSVAAGTGFVMNAAAAGANAFKWQQPSDAGTGATGGYNYADLSEATAATINSLREAFQLQRLYERDARGGTRLTEIIRAHFGVVSPDARMQRPEYLGGGSTRINVNPIAQTSSTDATTPQGNLAAMATFSHGANGFTKGFTEHCIVLGMVSVRADLNYQQGLNRLMSARTRWDLYWPALSHIGEQAVLNKEIYAQGTADDELVFGYQERYAEYRYKPSLITGAFRSTYASTLDVWHLAQEFTALPVLNNSFIQDNPPIDRVIATPTEPHFLFDAYFNYIHSRPIPTYGTPGMIDHF